MTALEHLRHPLATGDSPNCWQLAEIEERPCRCEPEPLPPATEAQFAQGPQGIVDLPRRRRFRSNMMDHLVALPEPIAW